MLCYEFPPIGGGAGRFAHQLAARLVRQDNAVDIVTMGFKDLPTDDVVDGIHVHRVPCVRLREFQCSLPEVATYLPGAFRAVQRLTSEKVFDLNHTHFILPDGVLAADVKRSTGLPFVVTSHGSDVPGYNPDRLGFAHVLARPLWRRVVRSADLILSPSENLGSKILHVAPEARVRHIPYGFEPSRMRSDRPKERTILVVTRMVQRKGVQYLLEAMQGWDPGWALHVVGDGPYLQTLREMAAARRVPAMFHGWLDNDSDELRALYESAGIFVMASESENFPVSLLEAMAAGAAIVTTSGTGCEEVVRDTALLFPPRDVGALRTALVRLTRDATLRARLGWAASRRLREELSWDVVTERYVAVYEQVLGRKDIPRIGRGLEGPPTPSSRAGVHRSGLARDAARVQGSARRSPLGRAH
jgi:glycosyltransferase involved in cell wall biosynthesis